MGKLIKAEFLADVKIRIVIEDISPLYDSKAAKESLKKSFGTLLDGDEAYELEVSLERGEITSIVYDAKKASISRDQLLFALRKAMKAATVRL